MPVLSRFYGIIIRMYFQQWSIIRRMFTLFTERIWRPL